MTQHPDLQAALSQWRQALGETAVLGGEQAMERYGHNTLGITRPIAAALLPRTVDAVVALVVTARRHGIALYPVSTGNNWGYGGAAPATDGCVIVDLSAMNRVIAIDAELGLATLEPGVTQGRLREYLDQHDLPFLVPVHGGGPDCSLLGNALERGYGITPYADHFGAVMALEAVLPTGEVYRSALSEMGAGTVDQAFKWGIGPYLDGLFSQSGFGIVTRVTIALAPIPERIEAFFFGVRHDEDLEPAIDCIRSTLRQVGSVTGSINLMNSRRVLSMMTPYPAHLVPPGGIISDADLRKLARRNRVMPWMATGAIYGNTKIVTAARAVIRERLRPVARRLFFLTPSRASQAAQLLGALPARGGALGRMAITLDKALKLMAGAPSEIALPLAYWRSGRMPDAPERMNPDRNGCGLIWYAPLVPMTRDRVRRYTELVETLCRAHGIEPLITLTSLSDRCFDSTVPLLFNRDDSAATARAHACHAALIDAGRREGFLPYRTNVQSMPLLADSAIPFWRLAARLKEAIDPQDIMSPGRYSLTCRQPRH